MLPCRQIFTQILIKVSVTAVNAVRTDCFSNGGKRSVAQRLICQHRVTARNRTGDYSNDCPHFVIRHNQTAHRFFIADFLGFLPDETG